MSSLQDSPPIRKPSRTVLLCGLAMYGLDLEIIKGLNLYRKNKSWFVLSTGHDHSNKPDRLQMDVDAVLAHVAFPELIPKLQRINVPVINISGMNLGAPFPRVEIDNQAVGTMAARFFLDRGYLNFLYVSSRSNRFETERWKGFRDELKKEGKSAYWLQYNGRLPEDADAIPLDGLTLAQRESWLKNAPKPLAVLCAADGEASAFVDRVNLLHIHVPEEIAVIGVGNHEIFCESAFTPLSSVEIPGVRTGYHIARALEQMMNGEEPDLPPSIQPSRIHERASTGAWAVEDPAIARILAFLREHSAEEIRIADLPAQFHMSHRGFHRHFKEHVGRTPLQELYRLRVEAARDLLATSDLYIGEISERTGFPDPEALTQKFRARLGLSPAQYRRRLRAGNS